ARAGIAVSVFDHSQAVREAVLPRVRASLEDMRNAGLLEEDANDIVARVTGCASLAESLADVDYIQESVFERQDVKVVVSAEIDATMPPTAIVGSSSSGIPASQFTEGLANRNRFLIVHPVNPPHLVP